VCFVFLNLLIYFYIALKEEKPDIKDLLADLQDISDTERKTSTAESSMGKTSCGDTYINHRNTFK